MKLSDAIFATAELCGTKLSEVGAELLLSDLVAYSEEDVIKALARCRRELKGRLTIAEIIGRIDDGRPGADEAWGMLVWEEEPTVVLTSEMQEAQFAAWRLWHSNDRTGARMAFKDCYTRLVTEAREERKPVEWCVALGWDTTLRYGPILEAVKQGRMSPEAAQRFFPRDEKVMPDGMLLESPVSERTQKLIRGIGNEHP